MFEATGLGARRRAEDYHRVTASRTALTRISMRLAAQKRIDPDRISFVKVLKHVRRSVIRQCAQTPVQIKQFISHIVRFSVRMSPG